MAKESDLGNKDNKNTKAFLLLSLSVSVCLFLSPSVFDVVDRTLRDKNPSVLRACQVLDCLWSDPLNPQEEPHTEETKETDASPRGQNTVR